MSSSKSKLELWFFRDLTNEQRNKLFLLFGLEDASSHGAQKLILGHILRTLDAPDFKPKNKDL